MRPAWEKPPYHVTSVSLGCFLVLTNVGAAYDSIAAARGLGFAEVDLTNVGSIKFVVRVNKIGTGTQSWQLWNDTDGVQVAVIDDAAAAGDNKVLETTVALTPGPVGIKRLRVRAKSTVAADDPAYYGACISLS